MSQILRQRRLQANVTCVSGGGQFLVETPGAEPLEYTLQPGDNLKINFGAQAEITIPAGSRKIRDS